MAFLVENALKTPKSLVTPDIELRLEATGAADRVLKGQTFLLTSLLSERRIKRMAEQATREPSDAYTPVQLVDDLTNGVFGELKDSTVETDLYRRNLQRTYVEKLVAAVQDETPTTDLPAIARGALVKILRDLLPLVSEPNGRSGSQIGRMQDEATTLHLADLKARISQALEPRPSPAPATGRTAVASPFGN